MNLPFFYINEFDASQSRLLLDEENSRHVVQVLRMKKNEIIALTDGKGNSLTATIVDDHKKHCAVEITAAKYEPRSSRNIIVCISLLKNAGRFEWFLEKATEVGISSIVPLVCARTERQKFREDRLRQILVSAMLQSQQSWLPELHKPPDFSSIFFMEEIIHATQKFIAHCIEDQKRNLADLVNESLPSQVILIGPEGDFTPEEVQLAIQNHFDAVSLGDTRLRAETAGVVAATLLKLA